MRTSTSAGRRNFLKMSAAGAAGLSIASKVETIFASSPAVTAPGPGNKWPGRVVINFNKAAIGTSGADTTVIKKMVDDAILKLTDQTTVAAAWKALFPASLTATSKIAIKICTANAGLPAPHWSSVRAITDGLQQMDFSGTKFAAANITIYEMNVTGFSSAGYTATNFPGISIKADTAVNGGDGALSNRTYAQTLKNAAFLINVFSPRGHNIGSTFTIGFKSHFGTYSNPSGMHTNAAQNLRDINCSGPIYTKNVLSVCSGIYGMNESNGPAGSADNYSTYSKTMDASSTATSPTTIIMSTDPISCEMQTIKMMRINKKGAYATANMPDYLKASGGAAVSGWSPINTIGTIDETKMDIRKIINGNSTTSIRPIGNGGRAAHGADIIAHQIQGHNSTFIEFTLPNEHVGKDASIEIYDISGALIQRFTRNVQGIRNHFSWDEKDARGSLVSKGRYVVRLVSGAMQASTHCVIMR
ncbi:MAG TPA: twin-arginine translocation signal domain-containing protein [Chitinivibrionales bacterium]